MEESSGEFLNKVGMDAVKWTDEFIKSKIDCTDSGILISWFANMIMAGYDRGVEKGYQSALRNSPVVREMYEALKEFLNKYMELKKCAEENNLRNVNLREIEFVILQDKLANYEREIGEVGKNG